MNTDSQCLYFEYFTTALMKQTLIINSSREWKESKVKQCVHLLLQAFDPVSVSSLSGAQSSLYVPKAGPQSLGLPMSLITLPHQTLTQAVWLLHLSQLSLLMKHTHAHTHTHTHTHKWKRPKCEHKGKMADSQALSQTLQQFSSKKSKWQREFGWKSVTRFSGLFSGVALNWSNSGTMLM